MAKRVPSGYTVAQLTNKRWYPLKEIWLYDGFYLEGDLVYLDPLHDGQARSYSSRSEAIDACHADARSREHEQQCEWRYLAVEDEVQTRKYVDYLTLIEGITEQRVEVQHWRYCGDGGILVTIPAYECQYCRCAYQSLHVHGDILEEVLKEAAERVYELGEKCLCAAYWTSPMDRSEVFLQKERTHV